MQIQLENTANMKKYITELEKLGNSANMAVVGDIMAENTKQFIPMDTGKLREAYVVQAKKDECIVTWDTKELPYAHYQFEGKVWGPNKAIFDAQGPNKGSKVAGVHSGWVSPTKHKKPAADGREMGHRATITLNDGRVIHINGYTTKGTGPKWTERALKDAKAFSKMRFESGRYLYEVYCMSLGITPVGGFQVMGKYV